MSKKKAKGHVDNLNWDEGLINESLSNDKWQPHLTFLVQSHTSSDSLLQSLTSAVQDGSRRRFIIIDKDSMLASAKDDIKLSSAGGGGGKKSKMGTAPPVSKPLHPEVCEHVVTAMSSGQPVQASLVARMLKYKILRRRSSDIAAQEALRREAEEALKASKGGSAAKAKGGGGRASKKGKDTPSGKGGKGGDAGGGVDFPMPQKPPTSMKKRGEEDNDSKYIDDEPKDGPSAFILLKGFNDAEVLPHLGKIGVTVNALVKISQEGGEEEDTGVDELSEEEQTAMAQRTMELESFWLNLSHIVSSSPDGSMMRNMALSQLVSPSPPIETDDNIEETKVFGQNVFTQLSQTLYSLLDSYTQYQNYLNYMNIRYIPMGVSATPSPLGEGEDLLKTPEVPPEPTHKRHSVDMRLYNKLMDQIPEDAVTPSLILHNMVEQVDSVLAPPTNNTPTDGLHVELNKAFADILSTLPQSDSNKEKPITSTKSDPCINWNDQLQSATHAIENTTAVSLQSATLSFPPTAPSVVAQYEKQLHSLRHFCATTGPSGLQVDTVFKGLLVAMSLEHTQPPSLSCPPENGFVTPDDSLLFDYPLNIALKSQESTSTALLPVTVETNATPTQAPPPLLNVPVPMLNLSNYTVLEPLTTPILRQIIARLRHSYPYLRLYYHKLTESLVIAMYSGHAPHESTTPTGEYSWKEHMHTKVGFSNYLKYIQDRVGREVDTALIEDEEKREELEEERKAIMEAKRKEIEEKQAAAKKEAESKQSSAKGGKKTDSAKKSGKKSALASGAQTPASTAELELITSLPEFSKRTLYTGYDVGDTVLLSMGVVRKAFTCDKVCLHNDQREVVEGPVTRRVSLSDKYVSLSAVSVLSQAPPTPPAPPVITQDQEQPSSPSDMPTGNPEVPNPIPQPQESVLFSALEGSLSDVTLSVSHYGPMGNGDLPVEPKSARVLEKLELQCRPESSKDSRPPSQQGGGKLSKKQQEEQQKQLEQQKALEERLEKEKEDVILKINKEKSLIGCCNTHQQLNLSTEYGLHINCSVMVAMKEGEADSYLIKQQAPLNDCPPPLPEETARLCLPDGSVIKYMKDKTVTVLCSDGTVLRSLLPDSPYETLWNCGCDDEVFNEGGQPLGTQPRVSFIGNINLPKTVPAPRDALWEVTRSDGSRCVFKHIEEDMVKEESHDVEGNEDKPSDTTVEGGEGEEKGAGKRSPIPLESLATYSATDPETNEVLFTREDKVIVLRRPDGVVITDHSDGTRITTRPSNGRDRVTFEHPLFSRVTYESHDSCSLELPSGLHITCTTPLGEYEIQEDNSRVNLKITSNGSVAYSNPTYDESSYVLSHTNEDLTLEAKDRAGHTYTVGYSNGITVDTNGEEQMCRGLLPKVFVLDRDGSGFQLCNKQEVDDFVNTAKHSSVVSVDKLPQSSDIDTVTVISTDVDQNNKGWMPYVEANIIPKNLQCYNAEKQHKEHDKGKKRRRFGVGVGKGLDIGSYIPPVPIKVFKKPKGIQYRQFIDFTKSGLRQDLLSCLTSYISWREVTTEKGEALLPDPFEEQVKASDDLLRNVMTAKGMASPDELLALYREAFDKENAVPPSSQQTKLKSKQNITNKPSINTVFDDTTDSKQDQEVVESHPEPPNMEELVTKLPINPSKHKNLVSFNIPEPPKPHPDDTSSSPSSPGTAPSLILGLSDMEISSDGESLPSTLRHAHSSNLTLCRSEEQSSPMPRPNNPTPFQAASSQGHLPPVCSTPVQRNGKEGDNEKGLTPTAPTPLTGLRLEYSMSGEMREYPVKLPHSISGEKPGDTFNEKYFNVEEPVRRKVRTSSTSQGATIRGFEVFPGVVQFGNLKEGCTYAYTCTLKNTGIDTCRFKIKNPPPSTGIRVLYKPGAVAAGMSREFCVEIFALAIGATSSNEVGGVSYEMEIITEANMLYLPVKACIFPSSLYQQCFGDSNSLAGATRGVQLISDRPSSREDINRPAKQQLSV